MAKIQKNSILQGIRGSLGDLVIREMRDGSIRVSVKPVKKQHTFNQEQKGCQDRMRLAVAYAKEAKTDPFYVGLALETGRDAYHVALSDGLKSPVIHAIERRDGRVRVTASDNVMVTRVLVSILDGEGNALEEGDAALPDPVHEPQRWEYAARAEGTVEATAWDLAGNRATATMSVRGRKPARPDPGPTGSAGAGKRSGPGKQSPIKRDISPFAGLRLNGDCFALAGSQ